MAPTSREPAEHVRRCARCGQATLVLTHAWQHTFAGVFTQTWTYEFDCRSCGVKVVLHPLKAIRAERLLSFLLMPAIIPGILFFVSARKKAQAWVDNPVVEGADPGAPTAGPPPRRCTCSAPAPCVAIAREGTWSVLLGRRADHRCAQCTRVFSVHDVRGVVFPSVVAAALFATGALVVLHPPGAAVGAERSNQWFGVALVALGVVASLVFVQRLRARLNHPELRSVE